jgi:hypothetical protein
MHLELASEQHYTHGPDLESAKGHIAALFSKKPNNAQANYRTTEQELLAVYASMKGLSRYLRGFLFTVLTDHAALRATSKSEIDTPRKARMLEYMQTFDYSIEHVPGSTNILADTLSRLPTEYPDTRFEELLEEEDEETEILNTANFASAQIQQQATNFILSPPSFFSPQQYRTKYFAHAPEDMGRPHSDKCCDCKTGRTGAQWFCTQKDYGCPHHYGFDERQNIPYASPRESWYEPDSNDHWADFELRSGQPSPPNILVEYDCPWARMLHDPMEPCDHTCCPFKIWSQAVEKFFEHLPCDECSKHRAVDEFWTSALISKLPPLNFEEYNKKQKEEEDRTVRELLEDSWDLSEVGKKLSKSAKKRQRRREKRKRISESQSSSDVSSASLPILRRTDSLFMSPKRKSAPKKVRFAPLLSVVHRT